MQGSAPLSSSSSQCPTHCSWTLYIVIVSYVSPSLCAVIGPYASSLCPMYHCQILDAIVRPYASSLCPTYLRWILRVVVGPYTSSLCPTYLCWISCASLLLGPMLHCWILHVVIGSYMPSSGPTIVVGVLHIISWGKSWAMSSFILISYLPWLILSRRCWVGLAAEFN
jgi:hypothetical protein